MRAGRLIHRITLQAPQRARDDYGSVADTWVEVATDVAAHVRDPVGQNYYAAAQEKLKVGPEVRIRWRRDVKSTWRVVFGNRTLEVNQAQDPDGKRRELVLYCKEIT